MGTLCGALGEPGSLGLVQFSLDSGGGRGRNTPIPFGFGDQGFWESHTPMDPQLQRELRKPGPLPFHQDPSEHFLGPQVRGHSACASPAPGRRPRPRGSTFCLPRAPEALFLPGRAQPGACGGMQPRINPRGPRQTAPGPSRAALDRAPPPIPDPGPRSGPGLPAAPSLSAV